MTFEGFYEKNKMKKEKKNLVYFICVQKIDIRYLISYYILVELIRLVNVEIKDILFSIFF